MLNYVSDIDECAVGTDICGSRGRCINTPGSYNCECVKSNQMKAMGITCQGIIVNILGFVGHTASLSITIFYFDLSLENVHGEMLILSLFLGVCLQFFLIKWSLLGCHSFKYVLKQYIEEV